MDIWLRRRRQHQLWQERRSGQRQLDAHRRCVTKLVLEPVASTREATLATSPRRQARAHRLLRVNPAVAHSTGEIPYRGFQDRASDPLSTPRARTHFSWFIDRGSCENSGQQPALEEFLEEPKPSCRLGIPSPLQLSDGSQKALQPVAAPLVRGAAWPADAMLSFWSRCLLLLAVSGASALRIDGALRRPASAAASLVPFMQAAPQIAKPKTQIKHSTGYSTGDGGGQGGAGAGVEIAEAQAEGTHRRGCPVEGDPAG